MQIYCLFAALQASGCANLMFAYSIQCQQLCKSIVCLQYSRPAVRIPGPIQSNSCANPLSADMMQGQQCSCANPLSVYSIPGHRFCKPLVCLQHSETAHVQIHCLFTIFQASSCAKVRCGKIVFLSPRVAEAVSFGNLHHDYNILSRKFAFRLNETMIFLSSVACCMRCVLEA